MKLLLIMVALFLSVSLYAQKNEDVTAIKSMCGCYEIKFNFVETAGLFKNYICQFIFLQPSFSYMQEFIAPLLTADGIVSLITLLFMEIVLGIDNIIFISWIKNYKHIK